MERCRSVYLPRSIFYLHHCLIFFTPSAHVSEKETGRVKAGAIKDTERRQGDGAAVKTSSHRSGEKTADEKEMQIL